MAMKPNFSSLLSAPAGEAKKPEALDAGNYPGIIKGYEYGDNNKNKTPYVRFTLAPRQWAEGVEPPEGMTHEDLTKRTFRRDFYLTTDALWRLDELLRGLELDLSGRKYEEVIPEAVGKEVMIEIQVRMNQEQTESVNQVGKLAPLE